MFSLQNNRIVKLQLISALILSSEYSLASELKVASWNIEWLDSTPVQRQQERTAADYAKLRDYARQLDADIIAFQEVADTASAARLFPADEYQLFISSRENDQKVGYAVRKSLHVQPLPELKALDLHRRQSLRYGLPLKVTAPDGKTLTLLNVHLKAGCYNNAADKQSKRRKNCQQLDRQTDLIRSWAEQQGDRNYAILGDFNRQLKNSADKYAKRLQNTGLRTTGNNNASQCYSRRYDKKKHRWTLRNYKQYIDHILLSDSVFSALQPGSFHHHTFAKDDVLNHYLSDHCPISVTLSL
ncbi:endonuclease/exonuclease/phosphatase family protein [Aliamphritea hakodatensis]|uniref:endonuclease/exonuclease/phosphatase family protein n=1 Tax=Aliamphritea hakodatensis TaxID=2895352 RepID=UPI0022FDAF5F|nr:endonuclease/exonuclease/phosphatase family protein [Aliamphritea hakodatensis]